MRMHYFKWVLIVLLFGSPSILFSQSRILSGVVYDKATNETLPSVTIAVEGMSRGTITNFDGEYNLEVNTGEKLVFSFIGYESQVITVANQTTLDVYLSEESLGLDEVLVIGYGSVSKKDATGSVSAVSEDDFNSGAINSPQELVTGKIAGVNVTSGGGAPGSGSTIRIRGGSSLSASNDPLIVIDGVPLDSDGVSGMRNPLNTVNPSDIETFTVLKDASATAIYGSRASNGVILITTKKSTQGAPLSITYNGNLSWNAVKKMVDVLSTQEYRDVMEENFSGRNEVLGLLGTADTDWQDEVLSNSFGTDHVVSARAAIRDVVPIRGSIGYSKQNGVLETSSMERYTASVGITPKFFDSHLSLDLNAKGMVINNRFANSGAIGAAIAFDPTQPVYDSTSPYGGFFTWLAASGLPNNVATANPVALLDQRDNSSQVLRSLGNIKTDYKMHFLPELKASLNLGYDYSETDGKDITDKEAAYSFFETIGQSGAYNIYKQRKRNLLLDFYLNYNTDFENLDSNFDAMLGYSWQSFWREDYSFNRDFERQRITSEEDYFTTEYFLVSFFGRINWSLKDKYLFTFTLRDDGTSRFSDDTRWGLFPAAAFAWRMIDEPWFENTDWLSNLKLRLGYGVTGQQNIGQGDYPYQPNYTVSTNTAQYRMNGQLYNTLRPDGYDANIKWEETTTYNFGIDYGILDSRINGTFDYYYRKTKDLLNTVPVAAGSNFTNQILTNVGNLKNSGFEFSVDALAYTDDDWNWNVGFNVAYNKNQITKLTAVDSPDFTGVDVGGIAGATGSTIQKHTVGEPAFTYFVYEQAYDPATHLPIEGAYVDRNGDGAINESDKYLYKKPSADVTMGLNTNLQYKNWDFSMSARWSFGNWVYNNVASNNSAISRMFISSGFTQNSTVDYYNTRFQDPQYFSDYYLTNASFFRIDNINFGYSFPEKVWNDMMNLRLTTSFQNVLVGTKYDGLDPEIDGGIDNNIYPRPFVWTFGVQATF